MLDSTTIPSIQRGVASRAVGLALGVAVAITTASAAAGPADGRASPEPTASSEPTTSRTTGAVAPSSPGPRDPGLLRVEVDPAIADASLMPGWIHDRNPRLVERIPAVEGHEQWIAVTIDGTTYDYRVSVVAMRDGQPVRPTKDPVSCVCTSEELLAVLDAEVAAAAEDLRATTAKRSGLEPSAAESRPKPAMAEPEPAMAEEHLERRSISGLGIGGIVVAAFGAAALGGGIAMVMVEPKPIDGSASLTRDWAPTGYAALGVGGAALAGGVTMLVVDVVRCRRADPPKPCLRSPKGSSHDARLRVIPTLRADSRGIAIKGRF